MVYLGLILEHDSIFSQIQQYGNHRIKVLRIETLREWKYVMPHIVMKGYVQ